MEENASRWQPPKRLRLLKMTKGRLLVLVGVLAIAAGGAGWYLFQDNKDDKKVAAPGVCTIGEGKQQALKGMEAIKALNVGNLRTVKETIEKIDGYQKDPNCMYIVTRGYIELGDIAKAKSSLETLKSVYDKKVGYDPAVAYGSVSLVELQYQIDKKEQVVKSIMNNIRSIEPSAEGRQ